MAVKFLLTNIEAIIFDLGGVVLNLKPQKTLDAFAIITGLTQQELLEYGNNEIFIQYEKGEISSDEFRKNLNELFGINIENNVIDKAWNAMLLDLPKDRLDLIKSLQGKFKTFILSNTNEIHIATFNKIVQDVTGGDSIDAYFTNVYYSYQVGMRKPDAEIFEMLIDNNSLDPSTTLFIDDTLVHIKSANQLGLQTWHLTNQEELFTVFGNG